MNQIKSALLAVVVRVGAEPPAHLIVVNQVTVLLPVASCCSLNIKHCPTLTFETASVLLPPSVTVWILDALISKVIVAPSVSAVSAFTVPFNVGFVIVGFVVSTTFHDPVTEISSIAPTLAVDRQSIFDVFIVIQVLHTAHTLA